jgi:hypothetical protein
MTIQDLYHEDDKRGHMPVKDMSALYKGFLFKELLIRTLQKNKRKENGRK